MFHKLRKAKPASNTCYLYDCRIIWIFENQFQCIVKTLYLTIVILWSDRGETDMPKICRERGGMTRLTFSYGSSVF